MAYNNEWTCTTCSRKMLQSQQQDHLAGKPHNNRLKQITPGGAKASSNSSSSLQAATAGDPSPAAAVPPVSTSIARTQKAKPKLAKTTHQSQPAEAKKNTKNRNARDKTIGIFSPSSSSIIQPPEPADAHPNWGFIGFQQSTTHSSVLPQSYDAPTAYRYDDYYFAGKGDNFGACDKDCGWCGHCMDNVYI